MAVSAFLGLFVPVVILAVAQFLCEFCVQVILNELRNGLFEQVLDVLHTAHIAEL